MKLTKTDKQILEVIKKRPDGISIKEIIFSTGLWQTTVWRRLVKYEKYRIVKKHRTFGFCFYKLNMKKLDTLIFFTIECPKCKAQFTVPEYQDWATCMNKSCVTLKGKPTRFFITGKRIR